LIAKVLPSGKTFFMAIWGAKLCNAWLINVNILKHIKKVQKIKV
jgi:hypothetical protein